MGESGRRQYNNNKRDRERDRGDRERDRDGGNGDNKNQRRRGNERDERSNNNNRMNNNNNRYGDDRKRENDELVVYRILCPDRFIGSVIGKSGKVINAIRQDSRARVKIVDPIPGSDNRVILIYCYVEEKADIDPDDELGDMEPLCPAQDALLRVHDAIVNVIELAADRDRDSDKRYKDKEECQMLIPSSQSAILIGKAGATIKKLRSRTHANIKVSPKDVSDPNQTCAMEYDNFLQITGDPEAVKRALFAVSTIMYKFAPKEDISLKTEFTETPPPGIIIPSDVPFFPAAGIYPGVEPYVPSRSVPSSHVQEFQSYADSGSQWPIYSSALPVASGYPGTSLSGELIIRVLCPYTKIGRVIGKGGASIKSVREASGARVDIDDSRRDECIVTVTATESLDDIKSMAVEAVLLLQGKINEEEDEEVVSIRLLVPSKVIGCIIGKSGSIINEIRKRTRADVRISKGDKPKCAEANDELIEVIGEVSSVRDALVQIVLRLRDDILKDRDSGHKPSSGNDSMYASASSIPLPSVSSLAPMGYEHRAETGSGLGLLSSSSIYGSLPMRDNGYGSYSSKQLYGGLPSSSSSSEMLIPGHAVGKVMGKGGANVENIRKISGADVEIISDSKSSRGDRVAVISGTSEQKRTAENLIQAFILAT